MHGVSPFCSDTSQLLDFYAIQVSSFRLGLFLDSHTGPDSKGCPVCDRHRWGEEATEELVVAFWFWGLAYFRITTKLL